MVCVGLVESENGKSRRDGLIDAARAIRPRDLARASEPVDQRVQAGKYTIQTLIDAGDPARAKSLAADAAEEQCGL